MSFFSRPFGLLLSWKLEAGYYFTKSWNHCLVERDIYFPVLLLCSMMLLVEAASLISITNVKPNLKLMPGDFFALKTSAMPFQSIQNCHMEFTHCTFSLKALRRVLTTKCYWLSCNILFMVCTWSFQSLY